MRVNPLSRGSGLRCSKENASDHCSIAMAFSTLRRKILPTTGSTEMFFCWCFCASGRCSSHSRPERCASRNARNGNCAVLFSRAARLRDTESG